MSRNNRFWRNDDEEEDSLFSSQSAPVKSPAPPTVVAPGVPTPFASDDRLIETARKVFIFQRMIDSYSALDAEYPSYRRTRLRQDKLWTDYLHQRISLTDGKRVKLARYMKRNRFSCLDREVFLILVLSRLGIPGFRARTPTDLPRYFNQRREQTVQVLRCASESGRLFKAGLITLDSPEDELENRNIFLLPSVIDTLIDGEEESCTDSRMAWPVNTEADLFSALSVLTEALRKRGGMNESPFDADGERGKLGRLSLRIERLDDKFRATVRKNPKWKLAALFNPKYDFSREERFILLLLIEQEALGKGRGYNNLSVGKRLLCAACESARDAVRNISLLAPDGRLISQEFIQTCYGDNPFAGIDGFESYAECDYELTEKSTDLFGVTRLDPRMKSGKFPIRMPRIRMEQLVLSSRVQEALRMATAQAKHAKVLSDSWGLKDVVTYGRAVTLLFAGPPGTGKTACAEALANELNKPLLVANYAQIVDCYVGVTGKNISRIFRQARTQDAVLFWDEADAMFYNRDMTRHVWEVQDANIILGEIERFEGVCILATNRKIALDLALERRISLKVEFERPDAAMRRQIWERLLPKEMPVEPGLDLDTLSRADLSGGEIKNAVINAARVALARDVGGPVQQCDFQEAVRREIEGRLRASHRAIGFRSQTETFSS